MLSGWKKENNSHIKQKHFYKVIQKEYCLHSFTDNYWLCGHLKTQLQINKNDFRLSQGPGEDVD